MCALMVRADRSERGTIVLNEVPDHGLRVTLSCPDTFLTRPELN